MPNSKTKKSSYLIPSFLIVAVIAGLVGYFIGQLNRKNEEVFAPISTSTDILDNPKNTLPPIENAELYLDKDKGIAFQYPKDTHRVKIDGVAEYNKANNAGIPESFFKMKGFNAPKVTWALKVEEREKYQGRYGPESPLTPFSVWVYEIDDKQNIQTWFDKYWYYPFNWGSAVDSEIAKLRPIWMMKIDGVQAFGTNAGSGPRGYQKYMYVQHRGKLYLFEILSDGSSTSLADQIAVSFKFLK